MVKTDEDKFNTHLETKITQISPWNKLKNPNKQFGLLESETDWDRVEEQFKVGSTELKAQTKDEK